MSLIGPEPYPSNPLVQLRRDYRAERAGRHVRWPPGDSRFDLRATARLATDPLRMLLDAYERHGPIFTNRLMTSRQVWMLGPEANHYILVSHAKTFRWRDGGFAQLIPLLGDGMLTIDGDFHRRARRIMLPSFHSESVAATADTMRRETERALAAWRPGDTIDIYEWTRRLALEIAMKALFGFERRDAGAAHDFEVALDYYGYDALYQVLRGPRTPWQRMIDARKRLDRLIYGEIAERRRTGRRGVDNLSLLLDAADEDGSKLTDTQIRDQVMTLLFAGHDTTTATIAFMFHELARNPDEADALYADHGRLDRVFDETLRLYPPAWIGPRRCNATFEFQGYTVPADMPVNYTSYVSHRLPHVFPDPHAFVADRMAPENKAKLPRGAYVPFGAGSRTCLGMRFGQQEIRIVARLILERFRLDLQPGYALEIRQTPTLGPKHGLPMTVRAL